MALELIAVLARIPENTPLLLVIHIIPFISSILELIFMFCLIRSPYSTSTENDKAPQIRLPLCNA